MLAKAAAAILLPLFGLHIFIDWYRPVYPTPKLEEDDYFDAGEPHKDDDAVYDFAIDVPQASLIDMKNRIREGLRRIPSSLENTNSFELGFNPSYLRNLSDIALTFDWRQHERFLNSFAHKTTEIEGLRVHFLHVSYPEQEGEKRYPLLLIHGYPSSFWDFYKIIPMLGNPSRFGFEFGTKGRISFDVVVPSIPGFGWSEKPAKSGFGAPECARIFAKLMDRLGYTKFFVHGSSAVGSEIASVIAAIRPDVVSGLHLSSPWIRLGASAWPLLIREFFLTAWTDGMLNSAKRALALLEASADNHVKRPDTFGIMADQSPVALAALLLDRWAAGSSLDYKTHPQGELQSHLTVDELLTQVHIYWLNDGITYALRFLHTSEQHRLREEFASATINVPTATTVFPSAPEHLRPSKALAERKFSNVLRYSVAPKGGEFAALENSPCLATEIFSFVETVELLKRNERNK